MKTPLCPDIVAVALLAKIVAVVDAALASVVFHFGAWGSTANIPTLRIAKAGAGVAVTVTVTGFALTVKYIVTMFVGDGVVTVVINAMALLRSASFAGDNATDADGLPWAGKKDMPRLAVVVATLRVVRPLHSLYNDAEER